MLLSFADLLLFCLLKLLALDLTVGLAIDKADFFDGEIAIDLSGLS